MKQNRLFSKMTSTSHFVTWNGRKINSVRRMQLATIWFFPKFGNSFFGHVCEWLYKMGLEFYHGWQLFLAPHSLKLLSPNSICQISDLWLELVSHIWKCTSTCLFPTNLVFFVIYQVQKIWRHLMLLGKNAVQIFEDEITRKKRNKTSDIKEPGSQKFKRTCMHSSIDCIVPEQK